MLPIIWERDASRGVSKGFTSASWKILNFVNLNSNMIELKKSVSRWTEDAQKDFSYQMTQAVYFRFRKNWWISLNNSGKTGPVRDRSDFNDALTTLNRLHQESGEQQLRPVPFWKYQKWHQSSSSSSSWWQWRDSWWSSWQVKEGPQMSLRAKRHDRTGGPVVCRLWIKPQTCDFQDFFLFCCSWIVCSWQRSAATGGECKDNTLQVHFRSVNLYKEFSYTSESE